MDQNTPPPAPASCSDCATKTVPTGRGAPSQSASRIWRSSDGKFRLDTPSTSVISDPRSQRAIVLDHLKKEAMIIPIVPAAAGTAAPQTSHLAAGAGQAPNMQVQELGKSMIEGHEVEGKKFVLTPPAGPGKPQVPQMAVPGVPASPKAPKPPALPSVAEVWTSVKLKTPVLTKVTTSAGEQTTYCKPTSTEEPHASLFQIPQGYSIKSKP